MAASRPNDRPQPSTEADAEADRGADTDGDDAVDERAVVEGDPETGSTETDPAAEGTGLPPAGDDPMSGSAPSG